MLPTVQSVAVMKGAISCLQNITAEETQSAIMAGNVGASDELELFGKQITQYTWLYV